MYVIGGTASKSVAEQLSQHLKIPLINNISKRFPDDELYIRILDDVKGEDIILIQTAYPDEKIIELFLLQDALREAEVNSITVIIPYLGYARQDKKFKDGEPISARAIARLISMNADNIITVDPHKNHILDFFTVPIKSCSAVSLIAEYFSKKNIDMILAPDKGALQRAQQAADIIGCELDYMEKTRINENTVEIKPKHLKVEQKTIGIIDDIISTGGTMATSIKELKKHGAKKVFVSCTHGLFAGDAIKKLISAGCDEIIATDTIENDYSKVNIAPMFLPLIH
jgi:ribose-phosphate pyrophosphokinase